MILRGMRREKHGPTLDELAYELQRTRRPERGCVIAQREPLSNGRRMRQMTSPTTINSPTASATPIQAVPDEPPDGLSELSGAADA